MGLKGQIPQSKRVAKLNKPHPALQGRETGGGFSQFIDVSGQTIATNTPAQSTESTLEKSAKGISEQLTLIPYQNTTSSVQDFLARVSLLLGSGEDSKILEGHCSLRYAASYGLKDLECFSLRMSKDSSPMTRAIPFKPFFNHWMNWGMTCNGKCLTARTPESHKIGNGCSLSDILETNPDQKYFLSEKAMDWYLKKGLDYRVLDLVPSEAAITKEHIT